MKKLTFLFWLLLLGPAIAADNAVVVTPGVGVTMKSKDVGGGVQAMQPVLSDVTGAAIYGVAGTANANILTVQGIASMTPVLATVTFASPQAVTQSGTWNITNVTGTVSLPTGAATAAGVATVNTTLGSPFQAGGSIGNTTFAATQATAASLNATVVGTGTFATQSTLAAETTKVIGTTRTLGNAGAVVDFAGQAASSPANSWLVGAQFNTTPTTLTTGQASPLQIDSAGNLLVNIKAGAAAGGTSSNFAAAFPSAGTAVGMSQGGNMVALTGTSNNLNVQCANCSGSGVSSADEAAFTAGTSVFAGGGGFFQTTATSNALTNGQQGMWQMTANRAGFVNLRNAAGTEIGTSTTPLVDTARVVGNTGAVMDAAGQNVAAPANWLQAGCQFQTTPTTITATNGSPCQMDNAGNILVNVKTATGLAQGSTTSGQTGSMMMGAVTTSPPTNTTAQTAYASLATTGGLRIAGDGTKLLVTPDSVALPANQSVNVAQINGVTPLMGNGATGTGSPRVTLSNDNSAVAGLGAVATGAAPPANAIYGGANTGGATGGLVQGMIQCNSTATYDASTTGSTQMVALAASQTIYVCGYSITVGGTATNVKLVYGTGSNCATGATNMTPAFQLAVNGGIVDKSPFYSGLKTASANALCINASAANAVQAIVYYAQF